MKSFFSRKKISLGLVPLFAVSGMAVGLVTATSASAAVLGTLNIVAPSGTLEDAPTFNTGTASCPAPTNKYLISISGAGFPSGTLIWAMSTIFSFVLGEVLEQQGAHGEEAELIAASVRDDAYPCLAAAQAGRFLDFDARFDFGLRVLLAGLTTELAGDHPGA